VEKQMHEDKTFREKSVYYQTYFNLMKGAEVKLLLAIEEKTLPTKNYQNLYIALAGGFVIICLLYLVLPFFNPNLHQSKPIVQNPKASTNTKETYKVIKPTPKDTTKTVIEKLTDIDLSPCTCLQEQVRDLYLAYQNKDSLRLMGNVQGADSMWLVKIKVLPNLIGRFEKLKNMSLPTASYDTLSKEKNKIVIKYSTFYTKQLLDQAIIQANELAYLQSQIFEQYVGRGSRGNETNEKPLKIISPLPKNAEPTYLKYVSNQLSIACAELTTKTQSLKEQKERIWNYLRKKS
jgi:hypothetical protein